MKKLWEKVGLLLAVGSLVVGLNLGGSGGCGEKTSSNVNNSTNSNPQGTITSSPNDVAASESILGNFPGLSTAINTPPNTDTSSALTTDAAALNTRVRCRDNFLGDFVPGGTVTYKGKLCDCDPSSGTGVGGIAMDLKNPITLQIPARGVRGTPPVLADPMDFDVFFRTCILTDCRGKDHVLEGQASGSISRTTGFNIKTSSRTSGVTDSLVEDTDDSRTIGFNVTIVGGGSNSGEFCANGNCKEINTWVSEQSTTCPSGSGGSGGSGGSAGGGGSSGNGGSSGAGGLGGNGGSGGNAGTGGSPFTGGSCTTPSDCSLFAIAFGVPSSQVDCNGGQCKLLCSAPPCPAINSCKTSGGTYCQ